MFSRSTLILLAALLGPSPALGQSQSPSTGCPAKLDAEQVLAYLNAIRAEPRACGQRHYVAADPLRWEGRLEQAAQGHASELAQGEQLTHLGVNGRTPRERLRSRGYLAFRVGENLGAGQESWDEVLDTWRSSAKHCENIMQPDFQDVALACASGPGKYGHYWVMSFGLPVGN